MIDSTGFNLTQWDSLKSAKEDVLREFYIACLFLMQNGIEHFIKKHSFFMPILENTGITHFQKYYASPALGVTQHKFELIGKNLTTAYNAQFLLNWYVKRFAARFIMEYTEMYNYGMET
jgi:hypothetical protein